MERRYTDRTGRLNRAPQWTFISQERAELTGHFTAYKIIKSNSPLLVCHGLLNKSTGTARLVNRIQNWQEIMVTT